MNSDDAHSLNIERGKSSEERFVSLFSDPEKNPPWLDRIVETSLIEDTSLGIDYHVLARDGSSIPVNVKSSYKGKRKFLRKHRSSPIRVCAIVMKDGLDDDAMRAQIVSLLERWKADLA